MKIESSKLKQLVEQHKNAFERVRDDAGDTGSLVHNMIQAWCEGLWTEDVNDFEFKPIGYLEFLSEYFPKESIQLLAAWFSCILREKIVILKSEMTVYSPKGYAGTLDAIGTLGKDKAVYIFDWKTSGSIETKHWVQVEAYRRAYMWMFKEEPVARVIVRLCKEENKLGTYEMCVRPLEIGTELRTFYDLRKKSYVQRVNKIGSDHEIDWQCFLAAKTIHDRIKMGR